MRVDEALEKQGFEFDEDRTEQEAPAEVWVNKRARLGIRLQWFWLRR